MQADVLVLGGGVVAATSVQAQKDAGSALSRSRQIIFENAGADILQTAPDAMRSILGVWNGPPTWNCPQLRRRHNPGYLKIDDYQ